VNGPIFVGGASRSGKTLMRGLLSSHSRIVVTRRTEMWPRYYRRFGDLGHDRNVDRCLDAMMNRHQIAALAPDVARLRRDFCRGPRTYARLFALFHEQYADRCGKARWGDQTGGLEKMADVVMAAYTGARFVHMVRDPRDRYVALTEKRRPRRLTLERSTLQWVRSAVLALRNARRYPDSYRAVSYEGLVSRSEETMRGICAFLDEDFEPALLRMENEPRYDVQRLASETGTPITTAYVGLHRDALDAWSRRFVGVVASAEMKAFGYTRVASAARSEHGT
jgi:Sulfotransferase family